MTHTPAQDFIEWRGLSWGPWKGDRLRNRPRLSSLERRARALAALAWKAEQTRAWYAENRDHALAQQAEYRARYHEGAHRGA